MFWVFEGQEVTFCFTHIKLRITFFLPTGPLSPPFLSQGLKAWIGWNTFQGQSMVQHLTAKRQQQLRRAGGWFEPATHQLHCCQRGPNLQTANHSLTRNWTKLRYRNEEESLWSIVWPVCHFSPQPTILSLNILYETQEDIAELAAKIKNVSSFCSHFRTIAVTQFGQSVV